ncbi:unnamed protein product [Cyprideis torosa]|uniref:Uncharacterized protein n=1 Tax=Cyprideis torosa TaxID=163714 RepID=A0A7R8W3N1_9CRUS|nr:unnamed protein product [Cyprideis torosa]CAG0883205.1 unnamed protein product [Cyprideis torosa]
MASEQEVVEASVAPLEKPLSWASFQVGSDAEDDGDSASDNSAEESPNKEGLVDQESSVVRQVAQIQRWTRLIFSPRASLVESADERFKHNLSKLFPPDDLTFAFSPARWPMECQVSPEKIHHLDSCPEEPELFYTPSGYEPKPQPVGEEEGIVVYQYLPTCAVNFFFVAL